MTTAKKKTVKKSAKTVTISKLNDKLAETLAKVAEQEPAEITPQPKPLTGSDKQAFMLHFLLCEGGSILKEIAEALGWKENSLRGAMSLYAKNHKEYALRSEKVQGTHIYYLTKAA